MPLRNEGHIPHSVLFFANHYKELTEKLVQLSEGSIGPFVSSYLAFRNKKSEEQYNIVFVLFLGVFIFLSVHELFY